MQDGYYMESGGPLSGGALAELRAFLRAQGISYAENVTETIVIRGPSDDIAATASLEGRVVKCVAVEESRRGMGLTAALIGEARRLALQSGEPRLFLYTKPGNARQFAGCGFYEVASTESVLLMEDRRSGFSDWLEAVRMPQARPPIAAVVMNCDPMTLGHRYLIEQAAARSGFLYVFVVSEDRGAIPAADRLDVVSRAVADIPNAKVFPSGAYMVSSATFPDYFLKDRTAADKAWCDLEIAVFCYAAKALGISQRFVGSEPLCPVTNAYNQAMKARLPQCGVSLIELPRLQHCGAPISASAVRAMMASENWEGLRPLVPEETWRYISKKKR